MTFDPSKALHFGQGYFPPYLVAIWHFEANWPLVDPIWPLHDFWPQQCIMLWSGVLPTKFGGHRALLNNLTATWPQLTPTWPSTPTIQQCITLWSGVLPTKFGGHRALLSKLTPTWPQLTPTWLWPQQCITLWSGILPTKFGGHRAFLSNLTPGRLQMTSAWPLTPAMHYALVRGSFHQIW